MPPVIPAVVGAVAAGSWIAGGSLIIGFSMTSFIGSLVLSGAQMLLTPKGKKGSGGAPLATSGQSFTINTSNPTAPRRIIFGETRVGGNFIYRATDTDGYYHFIIALASHEVQEIGEVWLGNDSVAIDELDANGDITSSACGGKYYKESVPHVRIKKYLGGVGQIADTGLIAAFPDKITTDFKLSGIAYIYVRLKFNVDIFPNGAPNITAWVKGMKCLDTRTNTTLWTNNATLLTRTYMTDTNLGYAVPSTSFNDTATSSAANICDEFVTTTSIVHIASAVTNSTDIISLDGTSLLFQTGDRVQLTTTGTLPVASAPLYILLDGSAGNYYSSPDSVAASITGDIDISSYIVLDDWTPASNMAIVSKYTAAGTRSYLLCIAATTGKLVLFYSIDGTTSYSATSTVAPVVSNGEGLYVRVTRETTSGNIKFYTSVDGSTWTQLGTTIAGTTGNLADTTALLNIGAWSSGTNYPLDGKIYFVQIYNGLRESSGTLAVDFDVNRDGTYGGTTITSSTTSEVWTQHGTASIETGMLALATNYYVIVYQRQNTPRIKLASSLANALAGAAINLLTNGTGTLTITKNAEPRYTAGGIVETIESPESIVRDMLSSMAGYGLYSGGKWTLKAGAYDTPTLSFDESDLISGIQVQTKIGRKDRFNRVQGTYISPLNNGQPADYPHVKNDTYATEDGGIIPLKLDLAFTQRPHTAQRLAKIALEKMRQEIIFSASFKLTAFKCQVGDNILLSISRLGWTNKAFEVIAWNYNEKAQGNTIQPFIDMTLRETASTVYDWASGEETQVDPAPNTDLVDIFTVPAPTGLRFDSAPVTTLSGDYLFRIVLSWDIYTASYMVNGGSFEIQYKLATETSYHPSFFVTGSQSESEVTQGSLNVNYDLRIRAINSYGVRSNWSTLTGVIAGSSGGVTSSEDWGTPWGSVGSSEDYGTPWGSVTSSEDWGSLI